MQTRPPAGAQCGVQMRGVGGPDLAGVSELGEGLVDTGCPGLEELRQQLGAAMGRRGGGSRAPRSARAGPAPTRGGQLPASSRSSSSGWSWGRGPETRGRSVTSEDTGCRCPEPRGHPAEPRRAREATCLSTEMKPLLTGAPLAQRAPDDHPRSGLLGALLNRNVPRTITHDGSTHQGDQLCGGPC